jgi:hypothetical protein
MRCVFIIVLDLDLFIFVGSYLILSLAHRPSDRLCPLIIIPCGTTTKA